MNQTKNNLNESKDLDDGEIDIENMKEKLNMNNFSGKERSRTSPTKIMKTGE